MAKKAIILMFAFLLCFALPVGAVDNDLFLNALGSIDKLNVSRPFAAGAATLFSGSNSTSPRSLYVDEGTRMNQYKVQGTINIPSGQTRYGVRLPWIHPIWLVVGYTYTFSLTVDAQNFDDNDSLLPLERCQLRLGYLGSGVNYYTQEIEAYSIVKNATTETVTIKFAFSLVNPASFGATPANFNADIGASGAYNYSVMDILFPWSSSYIAPVNFQSYFSGFKVERDSGQLYNALVIAQLPEKTANAILDEEEKRANQGGNDAIDDVNGAISDNSGGFLDALGSLATALSYNGTQAAWTFPKIQMPDIEGVMEGYTLVEEQPIDFGVWVQKMPASLLQLVRALTTIGLIVFCFKELWGVVSYVMVLKGDRSDG